MGCSLMQRREIIVETKEVIVKPQENWLTPCMHPLPILDKDGSLSNLNMYKWLSDYQMALEDCDNKIESIDNYYNKNNK